jgi:uncharacterized membrane-anchored protein
MRASFLAVVLLFTSCLTLLAADPAPTPAPSQDSLAAVASSLKWKTGTITLRDGLATIALPEGYRFLDPADTEKVLHDIWGNPPGQNSLGMIFPPQMGPLDHGNWAVVVDYEQKGYVKDGEADKLNYTDLLHQMQKSVQEGNEARTRDGYSAMQLVGWAEPPHYDHATHKLYWAKDVRFAEDQGDTLNYNIRILGRRGVLVLNAVASMGDLPVVAQKMPELMAKVDFQPGNTYADFDPKIDKVAKYGVAALIAGGAVATAAKFGLLKAFWPVLLVLKKFLIVIVVAIGAGAKKLMSMFKGKSAARPFNPPSHTPSSTPAIPLAPRLNPPVTPTNLEPLRPPPSPGSGLPPNG